ncbi:ligand-effect modulator 3 family [Tribonema minus]|uniref:Ligand-effect modulator 3 family n=1 Tax=Tribonema minus TaxID=303371 RepID=A0A836CBM9_9STRA|nr:ligand-effect modulator 3 family [Tribonema minus]
MRRKARPNAADNVAGETWEGQGLDAGVAAAAGAPSAMSSSGHNEEPPPEKKNRPKDSAFRQQNMDMWVPILTPRCVVLMFAAVAAAFIPAGVYLYTQSKAVVEYRIQYDGDGAAAGLAACAVTGFNQSAACTVRFDVDATMEPPIYVYYEVGKLLQNHRKYVKSRSAPQLTGDESALLGDDNCEPLRKDAASGQWLNPCGLIANSMFTDVLSVADAPAPFDGASSGSFMSETGIAWPVDRGRALLLSPHALVCRRDLTQYRGQRWAYWYPSDDTIRYLYETYPAIVNPIEGVLNEHFMVWMRCILSNNILPPPAERCCRAAGMPTFRKVYGRIDTKLEPGDHVTFDVQASYYVSGFDGTKAIVLSTLSNVGAHNTFAGPAYMAMGILAFLIAVGFTIKHLLNPRGLGDARFLNMRDVQ